MHPATAQTLVTAYSAALTDDRRQDLDGLHHSAHNWFWGMFGGFTIASSPVAAEYLAGESGILPIVGYGVLAAWLLTRKSFSQTSSGVPARMSLSPEAQP